MFGVIGGTGLDNIEGLVVEKNEVIKTPYGSPSEPLTFGMLGKNRVIFLARHGKNHSIPPHLINYQANIWALHSVGVKNLIAVNTVGSIETKFMPGDVVFPSQIIDYTYCRKNTFFDGIKNPVKHIDFTFPLDNNLRNYFLEVSKLLKLNYHMNAVYASVQGPRLESIAEINRYENDGANIVGMTGMPETSLAKEIGLNYALICPVANHASGRGLNKDGVTHEEISMNSKKMALNITSLIKGIIEKHGN